MNYPVVDRAGGRAPLGEPPPGSDGARFEVYTPWYSPKHLGRAASVIACVLLIVFMVHSVFLNERYEWGTVREYLFAEPILNGLWLTIWLTIVSMIAGSAIGLLVALARMSDNAFLRGGAATYVWFFRGTPLLVQLLIWYNLAALYPDLAIGIPFGPSFGQLDANALITPLMAAVVGFTINTSSIQAEIIRSGILAVDEGQLEAASAVGYTRLQTLCHVTLPQAMKVILPPSGNEVVAIMKSTSLVSVLTVADLLYSAQTIYSRTYQVIPLLIVVSIWYLVLSTLLNIGQSRLERHFGRGTRRAEVRPFANLFGWPTGRRRARRDPHARNREEGSA